MGKLEPAAGGAAYVYVFKWPATHGLQGVVCSLFVMLVKDTAGHGQA
jgi:hypothetical protein